MLSKAEFKRMKETGLRRLLMELFPEMGYKDVDHYHGGVLEQGKDITMWRWGNPGRVNVVALVKRGTISGQAQKKKGSACEVFMQVCQAFGEPYIDPGGSKRPVNKVLVVTNGDIRKEARQSLLSAVEGAGRDRNCVEFMDGQAVWSLVEKHLGLRVVIPKIEELQKRLSGCSNFYSFDICADEDGIGISAREKYPGSSKDSPIIVEFQTRFPNDEDGLKRQDAFKNAIKGKAEIKLTGDEITWFKVSEPFKSLFPFDIERCSSLTIGPSTRDLGTFRGKLSLGPPDQPGQTLEGLLFTRRRTGRTFEIICPQEPFGVTFKIDAESRALLICLTFDPVGKRPHLFLNWLRFQAEMKEGNVLRLTDLDAGKDAVFSIDFQHFSEPAAFEIVEFVEHLDQICKKLDINVQIPDTISAEDMWCAKDLCRYFLAGGVPLPGKGMTFSVEASAVPSLLAEMEAGQTINLAVRSESSRRFLLGQEIQLPPTLVAMPFPKLSGKQNKEHLLELVATTTDGFVPVSLEPREPETEPFRVYFEGWSWPDSGAVA